MLGLANNMFVSAGRFVGPAAFACLATACTPSPPTGSQGTDPSGASTANIIPPISNFDWGMKRTRPWDGKSLRIYSMAAGSNSPLGKSFAGSIAALPEGTQQTLHADFVWNALSLSEEYELRKFLHDQAPSLAAVTAYGASMLVKHVGVKNAFRRLEGPSCFSPENTGPMKSEELQIFSELANEALQGAVKQHEVMKDVGILAAMDLGPVLMLLSRGATGKEDFKGLNIGIPNHDAVARGALKVLGLDAALADFTILRVHVQNGVFTGIFTSAALLNELSIDKDVEYTRNKAVSTTLPATYVFNRTAGFVIANRAALERKEMRPAINELAKGLAEAATRFFHDAHRGFVHTPKPLPPAIQADLVKWENGWFTRCEPCGKISWKDFLKTVCKPIP